MWAHGLALSPVATGKIGISLAVPSLRFSETHHHLIEYFKISFQKETAPLLPDHVHRPRLPYCRELLSGPVMSLGRETATEEEPECERWLEADESLSILRGDQCHTQLYRFFIRCPQSHLKEEAVADLPGLLPWIVKPRGRAFIRP